ncbi:MAG: TonB family protein [Lewinellaceae bacterium]|nr:TonB family protein [Saprospiraceae bacterium]MCB9345269.1 TonB family protein [Lewinellaceae bacterium]
MVTFLIKLSICWGFFALLYIALLRKETFFQANRLYLLGTLILGLFIAAVPGEKIPEPIYVASFTEIALPVFTVGMEQAEKAAAGLASWNWLELIYWAGFSLVMLRISWGLILLIRTLRAGRSERLSDGTRVIYTGKTAKPYSFYQWIFLPEQFSETSSSLILAHERAHVRGKHSVDVLLLEVLSAIFWFHPFIYWYKRSIRTVHEYLADAAASGQTDKKQYGLLLIGQSQMGSPAVFANHFYQSPLKQRLVMLTKKSSAPYRALKFGLLLPLSFLFVLLFRQAPAIAQAVEEANQIPAVGFENPESTPQFPGGKEALANYLNSHLKYPLAVHPGENTARVSVNFDVTKSGDVSNVKATVVNGLKNIESSIANIEKVFAAMPKWTPASKNGELMTVSTNLNLLLQVSNEKSSKTSSADPEFPGGNEAMGKFLMKNVKYPESAKKENAEGVVVVAFVVQEDGSLSDIQEATGRKDLHADLVKEAIRVVSIMPKWKPGVVDGKTVKTKFTLPIKFTLDNETAKDISDIDKMPEYPGGFNALVAFMGDNIKYPEAPKKANITGTVLVSFIVETDGKLSNFEALKSPHPDLSAEAIRVMKLMPAFSPGMKDGKAVRVKMTLPVKFAL